RFIPFRISIDGELLVLAVFEKTRSYVLPYFIFAWHIDGSLILKSLFSFLPVSGFLLRDRGRARSVLIFLSSGLSEHPLFPTVYHLSGTLSLPAEPLSLLKLYCQASFSSSLLFPVRFGFYHSEFAVE